jgi:hypothetical protein
MNDRSLVLAMTQGLGANLTNDEKRAHLADLKREYLIDQVCIQECPSSDDLRLIRHLEKGSSGSSEIRV